MVYSSLISSFTQRLLPWVFLLWMLAGDVVAGSVVAGDVAIPLSGAGTLKRSPNRLLASVRVGSGGGCSGTIFARGETLAYGISAAHCSSGIGKAFGFGNADGSVGSGRWIAVDHDADLALFIVFSKDVLAAVSVRENLSPDFSRGIEAVGYPAGRGPKWKRLTYRQTGSMRSSDGRYFKTRYQLTNNGPGEFGGGDSGGGVFYGGNFLIGVMTHTGINAATHGEIVRFLRANRQKFHGAKPFG